MERFLFFYFIVILTLAPQAGAQSTTPVAPQPHLKFTMTENEGVGATLLFTDGREAQILTTENPIVTLKLNMSLVESTCSDKIPAQIDCTLTVPTRLDAFALVWTENPDSSALGMPVKMRYDSTSSFINITSQTISTVFSSKYQTITKPDFSNLSAELKCNDYSWLGSSTAPDTYHVDLWSGESMTQNFDTNLNENSTTAAMENITLGKKDDHLQFVGFENILSTSFVAQLPMYGSVNNVIRKDGDHLCQTSFSIDGSQVVKAVRDLLDLSKQKFVKPYTTLQTNAYRNIIHSNLDSLHNSDKLEAQ